MSDVDRRARDTLFLFMIVHPERYESLARYRSTHAEFRHLLRSLVPEDWTVDDAPGIWCMVLPPNHEMPDAGFKVHLSITHDHARELLAAIVPILVELSTPFKSLVDEQILDFANSSMWGRGASGKFVTIYPRNEESLQRIMERIHSITRHLRGPYILSDKRYKDSKVLFYRYGSFKQAQSVNLYGERIALMRTADGRLIPDPRLPYFSLPDGVTDPFPDAEQEADEIVLNGRYKALGSLGNSSKGGVYKCLDLQTGNQVVVKEARPFLNRNRQIPFDAVDYLRNEYRILRRLDGTGVAPRPLDFFMQWEHSFLVMELMTSPPLSSHLARGNGVSIGLIANPSADDVGGFCSGFLTLARQIIAGLRAIHACGVTVQDMSPRNLLYDAARERITFIDFEAAYAEDEDGNSPIIPMFTPGYSTLKSAGERPTPADDYRTLSRILGDMLYPPTAFFMLAPQLRRPMLTHLAKEKGVPDAFVELIFDTAEQPERLDDLLEAAEHSIKTIRAPHQVTSLRTEHELRTIVDRIADFIIAQINVDAPLDLPTDYRRFVTNDLSVAYGGAGIAMFLHRARGAVPELFRQTLECETEKIDNDGIAPGLFIGSAGVAWTLLEIGMRQQAEALLHKVATSPLLFECADMFYGSAGWGLTNLFFFKQLGETRYLENAIAAFDNIKQKLVKDQRGYHYPHGRDIYCGLAHGAAGIGYFLLRLYQVTGNEEHVAYARGLLDYDIANAEERDGAMLFRRSSSEPLYYPYWRVGSAGIGSIALRFHAVLGDQRYLDIAQKIAHSLAGQYTLFPSFLYGMAGIGNFLVDMHQYAGEKRYHEEARRQVDRVMLFAIEKQFGYLFPGEDLVRASTDYGTGSAGIGMFFHRIVNGGGIPYFDF